MATTPPQSDPSFLMRWLTRLFSRLRRLRRGEMDQREELFRLINDNIHEMVVVVGGDGLIRYITPSVQTLLGYKPERFIGLPVADTITDVHPDDRSHVADLLGRVLQNEPAIPAIYRSHHADGYYIWLESRATPLYQSDGRVDGLLIVARDINERVQAEENLRYQAALLENISDAVISARMDGQIVSWNAAAARIYGWTESEALGGSLESLLKSEMTPEQIIESQQHLAENGHWEGQIIQHRKDGTPVYVFSSVSLLRDKFNNPTGMIGINRDISDRMQAEKDLRESEAKFRAITETINAYIGIIQQTKTIYINPGGEKISGYSADELKAMPPLGLVHPDYRELVGGRLAARLRGEAVPSGYEMKIVRKDGQERWLFLSGTQITYGGEAAVLVSAFDITDSKQAEEGRLELAVEREKVRLLRQFISDLSHDLRNPMAIMNTSLYLLARAPDAERRQHHMNTLADQISHLERVLNDLKLVSRLDQQVDEFQFAPVDINALVRTVIEMHLPLAASKGHRLTFSPAASGVQALGDDNQLRQAITNLVVNALNYTPEGGQITLKTLVQEGRIYIEVQDNGIGIDPHDVRHIFDHFFRADKARSTDTGGVGLGLTIAERIVKAHGGRITVESAPGQGSCFRLWLPLVVSENST